MGEQHHKPFQLSFNSSLSVTARKQDHSGSQTRVVLSPQSVQISGPANPQSPPMSPDSLLTACKQAHGPTLTAYGTGKA